MVSFNNDVTSDRSLQPSRLDAARDCLEQGWVPIPVPARCKGPVLPGWPNFRPSPDELDEHFAGEGNIAVLTGEPSAWLVDVDLDCDEAVALADVMLPFTGAVTGHERRPRSHRWYTCRGVGSARFKDPVTGEMIVELRSTGLLSLIGPSVHPTGSVYDILDNETTEVEADELLAGLRDLAEAVCKMRGHRFQGSTDVPKRVPRETDQSQVLPDLYQYPISERIDRAARYLDALPPAVSGQGGHNATFRAACAVAWGFAVPETEAFDLLRERYNPRCDPPWTDLELLHKVEDALSVRHINPRGWKLASRVS